MEIARSSLMHGGIFSIDICVHVCVRLFAFVNVCVFVLNDMFARVCMYVNVSGCYFLHKPTVLPMRFQPTNWIQTSLRIQ